MPSIDLNADLGELPGPDGESLDEALLAVVTSANVACGGHAGDPASMLRVCRAAAEQDVRIGAHISYPDTAGFGRRSISMPHDALAESLSHQFAALQAAAARAGTAVSYVKPHGALYHDAATDHEVASVVVSVIAGTGVGVLSMPGRTLLDLARESRIASYTEAFADRGYRPDGTLVPRDQPGALLADEAQVIDRVVALALRRPIPTASGATVVVAADSICVHGDTPGAVRSARAIARVLSDEGISLQAFASGLP